MNTKQVTNSSDIMAFFGYETLPANSRMVSRPLCEAAHALNEMLPDSAEKVQALYMLQTARMMFMRAARNIPALAATAECF